MPALTAEEQPHLRQVLYFRVFVALFMWVLWDVFELSFAPVLQDAGRLLLFIFQLFQRSLTAACRSMPTRDSSLAGMSVGPTS